MTCETSDEQRGPPGLRPFRGCRGGWGPGAVGGLATIVALCLGCSPVPAPPAVTLATTTSVRDSGLLDELGPAFRRQTGIDVKVVAVGSGQALEMGRRGDADLLLTHAPDAERQFMAEGFGSRRVPVMYNEFVIVGPEADPAGLRRAAAAADALERIAESRSLFVSRGDSSGTHLKESSIWLATGIDPQSATWYRSTGSGMAETLRAASELEAYALTDRGTFLAHRERLDLVILVEGDPDLRNPYAIILVSSERHPHVNPAAARWVEFLTSPAAREVIARFGADRYGEPLFSVEPASSARPEDP